MVQVLAKVRWSTMPLQDIHSLSHGAIVTVGERSPSSGPSRQGNRKKVFLSTKLVARREYSQTFIDLIKKTARNQAHSCASGHQRTLD